MRVFELGGYPPPWGGNYVHIQRLAELCRSSGIDAYVLDRYGETKVARDDVPDYVIRLTGSKAQKLLQAIYQTSRLKPDLIHIHMAALSNFIFGGQLLLGLLPVARRIGTIHSGTFPQDYRLASPLRRLLIQRTVKEFDQLIAVNVPIQKVLIEEIGYPANRVHVIPAFLPPARGDLTISDPAIDQVKELRERCRILIVVSGYLYPLWGFHVALDALATLNDYSIGMVLVAYGERTDSVYAGEIVSRLARSNNAVMVKNIQPDSFISLLSLCDLFVRPTAADGDSMALRESAYLGKPIVASDAAPRPTGCLLFRQGDPSDLARCIEISLRDPSQGLLSRNELDFGSAILDLYRQLCPAC